MLVAAAQIVKLVVHISPANRGITFIGWPVGSTRPHFRWELLILAVDSLASFVTPSI
jgi:hypothetical protein